MHFSMENLYKVCRKSQLIQSITCTYDGHLQLMTYVALMQYHQKMNLSNAFLQQRYLERFVLLNLPLAPSIIYNFLYETVSPRDAPHAWIK